jgi:hypothetical protein
MITFTVTNTRVEGSNILIFYEFNNGEINSHTFPLTANFVDIMAWGTERAAWFEQRELDIIALQNQLVEEVVDDSSNI